MGIEIDKNTRAREHVEGRALYFKLCRDHTSKSFHDIGATLNKNHATVMHAVKNVYPICEIHNPRIKALYDLFSNNASSYTKAPKKHVEIHNDNNELKLSLINANLENVRIKDSMSKSQSVFEDLDDDEIAIVLEKISVFTRVIKAQRKMKRI